MHPNRTVECHGGSDAPLVVLTGRSASVAVLERSGSFSLRTNGLPEAEVFAKGADKLSYTRIRWLPALPKVLRPKVLRPKTLRPKYLRPKVLRPYVLRRQGRAI